MRITKEEYEDLMRRSQRRELKYRNIPTEVNGKLFASRKESIRYEQLRLAEKAGTIKKLVLQPRYELQPAFERNGKHYRCIEYVGDFSYEQNGKKIVEDVKGMKTQLFRVKEKLFLYVHGADYELRVI